MANTCNKCGRAFESRNKLFKHLKHPQGCDAAASAAAPTPTSGDSGSAAAPAGAGRQLAELIARLAAGQGGVLEAAAAGELLTRFHNRLMRQYTRERQQSSGEQIDSWLATLVRAHPELLRLERAGEELQIRCDDELAATAATAASRNDAAAVVDAAAAAEAADRLRSAVVSKAGAGQAVATEDGWLPVPWLVRAVEKRLAAYVLLAPRADLARAADPGRFALPTATAEQLARRTQRRRRGGVSWATLTAHFRQFAVAEASGAAGLWEWDDGPADERKEAEYAAGSCYLARIRLRASARAESPTPAGRRHPHRRFADDGGQESAGPALDSVDGDALTLAAGSVLLVVAGQAPRGRIGPAVALELRLAAEVHGVSGCVAALSPGLCALRSGAQPAEGAGIEGFLDETRRLAAVRRAPLRLLHAGGSGQSDIAKTAAAAASLREGESWGLEIEALYPENVPARLPYHRPPKGVGFAVALSAELGGAGGRYSDSDPERRRFVAIEALSPHTGDPAGRLLLAEEAAAGEALWAAGWWERWQHRPHAFDGCLDLHLAAAAVNIARFVVLSRRPADAAPAELALLDPCSGSGTIAAAALGTGGWGSVLATEIRPEWVAKTKENMQHAHRSQTQGGEAAEDGKAADGPQAKKPCLASGTGDRAPSGSAGGAQPTRLEVHAHDALLPFGSVRHGLGAGWQPSAVVVNPPWGKRIGSEEDASGILRALLSEFAGAVFVVICPSEEGWVPAGMELLHSVRVGGKSKMTVIAPLQE